MAPTKSTRAMTSTATKNKQQTQLITTRSMTKVGAGSSIKQILVSNNNENNVDKMQEQQGRAKRKAEKSPLRNEKVKRSALGNLTNNTNFNANNQINLKPLAINKGGGEEQQTTEVYNRELVKLYGNEVAANAAIIAANNENSDIKMAKVMTRARSRVTNAGPISQVATVNSNEKIETDLSNIKDTGEKNGKKKQKHYDEKDSAGNNKENENNWLSVQMAEQNDQMNTLTNKTNKIRKEIPAAPVVLVQPIQTKVQAQNKPPTRRISNQFNETEESVYMSALEDCSTSDSSSRLSGNFENIRRSTSIIMFANKNLNVINNQGKKTEEKIGQVPLVMGNAVAPSKVVKANQVKKAPIIDDIKRRPLPPDIEDYDKKLMGDPTHVPEYAMDIFEYLKEREKYYIIEDYMDRQVELSVYMRTLLIDWMVEVQETFELNHETLYLAVKIVDLYLSRAEISKDLLQLLGATAFFVACKYDERTPPLIDDFLYICDGAYKHKQFVRMEIMILRVLDFNLGIPLSYRFLRRYARCNNTPMPVLTLARYILEMSLLNYEAIFFSDSKMAAAALYIAYRMYTNDKDINNENVPDSSTDDNTESDKKNTYCWNSILEYYSGYKVTDFCEMIFILNGSLHRQYNSDCIKTIRSKYSHKIFFEVAKIKLLPTVRLLQDNMDLQALMPIEAENNTLGSRENRQMVVDKGNSDDLDSQSKPTSTSHLRMNEK